MKLVYCLSIVNSLLIMGEGASWWKTTTTKAPPPIPTTDNTPGGSGLNLKGKMITVSRSSGVTFYLKVPPTTSPTTTRNNYTTTTRDPRITTASTPRPTPAPRSLSVCLRFLVDSSVNLFTLDPDSHNPLSFSMNNPWYTLWQDSYYQEVSLKLNPIIPVWPWVQTQPWTSVCVVLDSYKNVLQVFQGGSMSIRKRLPSNIRWSGTPVLKVSGFDGQVTDLEVWDYPLENTEIFSFMQNYGSRGTILTWSNVSYQPVGDILIEDTYALGQSQPLGSSEREERPIRSKQGRGQRHKDRKKDSEWRQRKRQML